MPRLTAEPAPICDNTDYKTAFHQGFYWRGRYYANLLHYIKDHIGTNEKWWREKVEYQHIVASQYNAKVYKDTVVRENYIPAVTTEEQVHLLEVSDSIEKIETANLHIADKLVAENIVKPTMVGSAVVGEHLVDVIVASWDTMFPDPILVSLEKNQLKQFEEDLKTIENLQIGEMTTPGVRTISSGLLENFREQAEFLFDMLERAYQDVLDEKVSILQRFDCSKYIDSPVLADIDIKTHCEEDFKRYQEETGQTHLSIDTHRLKNGLILTKGELIQLARKSIFTLINDLITYNKEKLLEVEPSLQRSILQVIQKEKDETNEEFQKRFSDISVLLRHLFLQPGVIENQDEQNRDIQFVADHFGAIIQFVQYGHIFKDVYGLKRDLMEISNTWKGVENKLIFIDYERFKKLAWLLELLNAEEREMESFRERLQPFMSQDSRQIELQLEVLRKMSDQTTLEELEAYFKEIESIYSQHPHEVEQFRRALSMFQCTSDVEKDWQKFEKQQTPKEINDEKSEMFGSDCQNISKIESLQNTKVISAEFLRTLNSLYVFRENPTLLFDFMIKLESVKTFLSGSEEQKNNALKKIKAIREQIPLIRQWLSQETFENMEKYLNSALILKGEVSTDNYLNASLKTALEQIQEENFDQLRSLSVDLTQIFIKNPKLLRVALIKDPELLKRLNLNSQQLMNHFQPQLNSIHTAINNRQFNGFADLCFEFDNIQNSEQDKLVQNLCNRTLFKARDQVVITVMQSLHSLMTELVQVNTQVDLVKTILSDAEEKEEQTIGDIYNLFDHSLAEVVDHYLIKEQMQTTEEQPQAWIQELNGTSKDKEKGQ